MNEMNDSFVYIYFKSIDRFKLNFERKGLGREGIYCYILMWL